MLGDDPKIRPDKWLKCKVCGRTHSIKNNAAIAAETDRLARYLQLPAEEGCPDSACASHGAGVVSRPDLYVSKGLRGRSRRYRCRGCGRVFSVPEASYLRQRAPHHNKTVFKELVSRKPIRGIVEITDLQPAAVYGKIDFIHRQCVGFAGERERRMGRIERHGVRLCVDRQDYLINWRSKRTRKNVQMTAICSVDAASGYVLGHHLNYDPDISEDEVEDAATLAGDREPGRRSYFRAQPQYWLRDEFEAGKDRHGPLIRANIDAERLPVERLIDAKRRLEGALPDPEKPDRPGLGNQPPARGVMTHLDYTAYAHARLVRRLLSGTHYLTIYCDQDEVSRAAFISAFTGKIAMGEAELAYVQFHKGMEIDRKRRLANGSRAVVARLRRDGETDTAAIARHMAALYARAVETEPDWRRRWIPHPKNTMNEPHRRVLYLTDTGDKDPDHIGWVLARASLSPVDTYFMRLRRKVQYFERGVPTKTNADKLWHGYHPYDPWRAAQLLEIFRVYSNFIWRKADGETPAMKFGLAKGPVRYEDVLYWRP